MNKGIIITFIENILQSFAQWLDNSILGKISRFVGKIWNAISKNSFFVNWFKTSSLNENYRDNSIFYRVIVWFVNIFRKIAGLYLKSVEKSVVIQHTKYFLGNIFDQSVSHYGVYIVFFSLVYAMLGIVLGGIKTSYAVICAVVALIGLLLIIIKFSPRQIFAGSFFKKCAFDFLNILNCKNSKCIPMTKAGFITFAILGAFSGCICYVLGLIYGTVLVAGIAFVVAVLYNFRLGVYLSLIAFPFAPTMAIVGITMLTIFSLGIKIIFDKDFCFVRTKLDLPIIVFMVVLVISTITSYAPASSIKICFVYLAFILAYFCITNTFTDFKNIVPIIVLMMIAALGVSVYGIYQHIFGFAEGKTWTDTDMFEDIATRVVSTFDNPNVLGEYLLLMIPVGFAMYLISKGGVYKLSHLAITAALCVCMIYTYSRGNWIGLIVAIAMFVLFYDTRFVWLGILAVLFAPAVLSQSVITRFTSIGNTTDTSTSYRVYIWMGSLAMLKDYWYCGIGLGSDAFNMIYPHYAYAGIVAPHAHNLYLQLLVENGILGLVVFLVMMITYYKTVISKLCSTKEKRNKAIITALSAGVFGYLVQGMFDNVWYNYRIFYMFFAIIALTMSAVNASRGDEND